MECPYCGDLAIWCENKEVYGRNLGKSYMIYLCKKCDAYVGCHNNTTEPLGTMANKELRVKRVETHAKIDVLWKSEVYTRKEFYQMLEKKMGREVHIGACNLEQCDEVIKAIRSDG